MINKEGEVNCPPRLFIDIPKYQGTTILKPSYIYNNSYNLDSGLGFKVLKNYIWINIFFYR